MRTSLDKVGLVLFGKAKRAILAQLLGSPDRRFYVRELARAANVTPSTLSRDLSSLADAEIIVRTSEGRNVYYQANSESPVFGELRGLITKTFGFAGVLKSMLSRVLDKIQVAAIYGSVARGDHGSRSDIDLLIVGNITSSEFGAELTEAEQALGRQISPTVYSSHEFASSAHISPFLKAILDKPMIFLKGDANELKRIRQGKIAKPRRAKAAS